MGLNKNYFFGIKKKGRKKIGTRDEICFSRERVLLR